MPIWEWIVRDLVPEPAQAYSHQVATALLAALGVRGVAVGEAQR